MRTSARILTLSAALLICLGVFSPMTSTAAACPNCKLANETDDRRPKAYMYSILFMIGMPATIFTGFGLSFYRMARNERMVNDEGDGAPPSPGN